MKSKFFRPAHRLVGLASVLLLTACQPATPPDGVAASPTPVAAMTASAIPVALVAGEVRAGEGIKDVTLEQTKAEVEKALGTPEEVDSNEYAPGQSYALYYSKGIELSYSQDKLTVITLHGPDDKWQAYSGATKEGLGVGSTAQQVSEALGEPDSGDGPRAMRYRKLGLWFRLDAERSSDSAKAESLQVMRPE